VRLASSSKDKKRATIVVWGLEGIEGFFRLAYVISPFYFLLVLLDGGLHNPVHAITRKSLGDMTRKLSVTESRNFVQSLGTVSRRNLRVAPANSRYVA